MRQAPSRALACSIRALRARRTPAIDEQFETVCGIPAKAGCTVFWKRWAARGGAFTCSAVEAGAEMPVVGVDGTRLIRPDHARIPPAAAG
jgi:hypothetical protein